jgi:hypothetical protein
MTGPVIIAPSGLLSLDLKRAIRQLAAELDVLERLWNDLSDSYEALDPDHHGQPPLQRAKAVLARYRKSSVRDDLLSGKFRATEAAILAALPASDWWDETPTSANYWDGDGGEVKMSAILQEVAMFVASFPQNTTTAEIFAAQMAADIQSWQPHPFEIEEAFRELRHSKKFVASTAEVYPAWQAASDKWRDRWDANHFCESCADSLAQLIAATEEEERQRLEREERERIEREEQERAREERRRIQREHDKTAQAEAKDVRRYLREINQVGSADAERQAPYKQRVEALICYAQDRMASFEKGVALGSKHHDTCATRNGEPCNCIPALWAYVVPNGRWNFFVNEQCLVTSPELTLAEAKALAVGKPKPA